MPRPLRQMRHRFHETPQAGITPRQQPRGQEPGSSPYEPGSDYLADLRPAIERIEHRTNQAMLLLILLAVLWFGVSSIGATLP